MMMIKKEYTRYSLLISDSELERRISLIEKLTSKTAYSTKYQITHRTLTRIIPKGPKSHLPLSVGSPKTFVGIAKFLDKASSLGLVHGDIHWKNIIDASQPTLVDWEPCLYQIKSGRPTLMVTYPWIDPIDRLENNISIRTDLMCFFRLLTHQKRRYFNSQDWINLRSEAQERKKPFSFIIKSSYLAEAH